jgi:hypothetical protein
MRRGYRFGFNSTDEPAASSSVMIPQAVRSDVTALRLAACFLAVYASYPPVARREATLATDLPAAALTGPDLHRLDFFERSHRLLSDPPLPLFCQRDTPAFSSLPGADRAPTSSEALSLDDRIVISVAFPDQWALTGPRPSSFLMVFSPLRALSKLPILGSFAGRFKDVSREKIIPRPWRRVAACRKDRRAVARHARRGDS